MTLIFLLALIPPTTCCLCCPLLDASWQQQSQEERSWMYSSRHSSSRGGSDCESEQVSVNSSKNNRKKNTLCTWMCSQILLQMFVSGVYVSMFTFPVINLGNCRDQWPEEQKLVLIYTSCEVAASGLYSENASYVHAYQCSTFCQNR